MSLLPFTRAEIHHNINISLWLSLHDAQGSSDVCTQQEGEGPLPPQAAPGREAAQGRASVGWQSPGLLVVLTGCQGLSGCCKVVALSLGEVNTGALLRANNTYVHTHARPCTHTHTGACTRTHTGACTYTRAHASTAYLRGGL